MHPDVNPPTLKNLGVPINEVFLSDVEGGECKTGDHMTPDKLNILLLSTTDQAGGAEETAWTRCVGFRSQGHSCHMLVGDKRTNRKGVTEIPKPPRGGLWGAGIRALDRYLLTRQPFRNVNAIQHLRTILHTWSDPTREWHYRQGKEEYHFPETRDLLRLAPWKPDILHCHNLHGHWMKDRGYFDLRQLADLSRQIPCFAYVHDLWLLTGRCAYPEACGLWTSGCGACPDLSTYPPMPRDASAWNWMQKREVFQQSRLYLASSSQWTLDHVPRSILRPSAVECRVIPYGFDMKSFSPGCTDQARRALDIPKEVPVFLFLANGVRSNPRKGFSLLEKALALLPPRTPSPILLAVGEDAPPMRVGGVEVRFFPYASDVSRLVLFYQAADFYVHAASAEVFGRTIVEAQACGCPVLAPKLGGIPEIVRDWREGVDAPTGLLVKAWTPEAFAEGIQHFLSEPDHVRQLGQNATAYASSTFSMERHIDAFLTWYHEVALSHHAPRHS